MARREANIMRNIRLKLKSGFLKQEPEEYVFMKRYPPLTRDTAPRYQKLEVEKVPYVDLYHKAVDRNPLYEDEKVYSAYFREEPQALTLAKKQYEFMQSGLDEESAYHKAVAYVDVIENDSFAELKKVFDSLQKQGVKQPFMADPSIASEIAMWTDKMKTVSYNELELADQGEIDFLIQTKILKWNEVHRERRMKDPVFAMEFEKLRETIFPKHELVVEREKNAYYESLKADFVAEHNLDLAKLSTRQPFFAEDYIRLFNRILEQPDLRKWSSDGRSDLSRWIVDCLALRKIVEHDATANVQKYLNDLRVQFFPMIHFPDTKFEAPTMESLKEIMYANGIGYKLVNDKLYVKRFYRLPMLLFPKETFTSSIVMDHEKLQRALNDDNQLMADIAHAGLDEKSLPELREQLQMFLNSTSRLGLPNYSRGATATGVELDDIMTESFRKRAHNVYDQSEVVAQAKDGEQGAGVEGREKAVKNADDEEDEERNNPYRGALKKEMTPEAWAELVRQYLKAPDTELEKARQEHFPAPFTAETAKSENDLSAYRAAKIETDLIVHARMGLLFERKEAARRKRQGERKNTNLKFFKKVPFNVPE